MNCRSANFQPHLPQETRMRKLVAALMFLIVAQTASFAQTRNEPRRWGYLFGGVGSSSGSSTAQFQVGGGGEALAHKGLGLGAENRIHRAVSGGWRRLRHYFRRRVLSLSKAFVEVRAVCDRRILTRVSQRHKQRRELRGRRPILDKGTPGVALRIPGSRLLE